MPRNSKPHTETMGVRRCRRCGAIQSTLKTRHCTNCGIGSPINAWYEDIQIMFEFLNQYTRYRRVIIGD